MMISIDMLPDDVLLEIFGFYVNDDDDLDDEFFKKAIEVWQTLVHVCRRWRSVVFGSTRRLKLRLVCTSRTPVRNTLDAWPSLPLIRDQSYPTEGVDNTVAVLERSHRVVKIDLFNIGGSELDKVLAAMQEPFPELTYLQLHSNHGMVSVVPDSFLGGSAPRLQFLFLIRIPFPGLPKLLLSATHLVTLRLWDIPHSGYFSPEAMVIALSTLTRLDYLVLEFESPRSRPDWESRPLPPPTRSVLPVLTYFTFKGVCEYLEDLVTRIDAPRLNKLYIIFFNQIVFDAPQFIQFIRRTPTLETFEKALVVFEYHAASVNLPSSQTSGYGMLNVKTPCIQSDWQVSSIEQVCTSCLPPLSTLEDLYIYPRPNLQPNWQDNIENTLWLELLQPFTAVKNLYLSEEFALRIVPALQELVGGRTTEVLPTLQNVFLEGLQPSRIVQEGIQQFVATRQVTSHPIAVSRWDRDRSRLMY
jgi:hypothetical protein